MSVSIGSIKKTASPTKKAAHRAAFRSTECDTYLKRRRAPQPTNSKPISMSANDPGSGTLAL